MISSPVGNNKTGELLCHYNKSLFTCSDGIFHRRKAKSSMLYYQSAVSAS